jgi:hypothetical protein
MNFVENPLKRGSRRVKTIDAEEEEVNEKIDFTRDIKVYIYTILMKYEDCSKK